MTTTVAKTMFVTVVVVVPAKRGICWVWLWWWRDCGGWWWHGCGGVVVAALVVVTAIAVEEVRVGSGGHFALQG
ncbi:hypothetical protein ACFX2I_027294 [Malus domestica]